MSDVRIFCIAWLVAAGLIAAADNHDWLGADRTSVEALMLTAFAVGCAAVALFGKRAQ